MGKDELSYPMISLPHNSKGEEFLIGSPQSTTTKPDRSSTLTSNKNPFSFIDDNVINEALLGRNIKNSSKNTPSILEKDNQMDLNIWRKRKLKLKKSADQQILKKKIGKKEK
jgi:hypothetical protein